MNPAGARVGSVRRPRRYPRCSAGPVLRGAVGPAYRAGVAEIELGRGTTPLPAALHADAGSEQRCVVRLDDVGYHIEALESLSVPSWRATFPWPTVQHLEVEPTELGVSITIADQSPGSYRVELRNTTVSEVETALAPYAAPEAPAGESR